MSSGEEAVLSSTQGAAVMKEAESDEFEQTKPGKDYGVNLINNPGNPVFSCTTDVNASIIKNTNEDCFEGYSTKKQNPMYLTSAMEYGRHRPTVHTMPTSFHAKCQKFTEHLGKCGMYRNQSLNTAMDKSIV
ncbi:piercer of microtubule wall 1 protein-like isoform X1 [Montipora capricornis]|uniref:piercer of microtubule wall 1 protein-like isoform X1 n=1 Tax=Montipora foliosa TaxID=591990 RepID=UPI0035F116EB